MSAFPTPCANVECGKACRTRYCDDCRHLEAKERGRATKALSRGGRGYGRTHQRWRLRVLAADPVCLWPIAVGVQCIRPATVADHVVPVAVAPELRYNLDNGQGLCSGHHAIKTAQEGAAVYFDTRKGRAVDFLKGKGASSQNFLVNFNHAIHHCI